MRDLYGNRFAFGYDNALRLVTDTSLVGSGNQAVTTRTYDDESRIVAQIMLRGATALDSHTVAYDLRSKILKASYTGSSSGGVAAMHYARLGPLTNSADGGIAFFNDSVSADPLGNTHTSIHAGSISLITNMTYAVGTTMLTKTVTLHGLGNLTPDTTTTTYDQAGSASVTTVLKYARDSSMLYHIYSRAVTTRAYGSDLKMMVSVTHFDTLDMWTRGVKGPWTYEELEEYRYDALGRRVWRRLTRPNLFCPGMDKASGCLSVVERTIWDGAQVLGEVRADGGQATPPASMECDICTNPSRPKLEGRVLYVQGGALDHPLDVVSVDAYNDIIVPVYNWRGRAVDGICVNGTAFCETDFTWPARSENAQFDSPPVTDPVYGGPVAWAGNIIDTQQDGSGLIYKRNRYYDPASGRFTQIDPIGLGGGLNAYGFGGGDQVSYTDPFGLCPPTDADVTNCDGTTLGNAWRALDGAGARGKEVIAGIVKKGISVSAGSVATSCQGRTKHGCTNPTTMAITVEKGDNSGTMATTIAHEFHHTDQKTATTAKQVADNEQDSWDYATGVYDNLQSPYKEEAEQSVGSDFTSERPANPDRKANWNKWMQEAHTLDGYP